MNSSLMLAVLYAGLAGVVLALVIATAQQKWSCKVFFLLALRLAIGWHFLFEGLYKVNSVYTGPTDTNRPFTSEPYMRAATGPIGPYMRKQFSDPGEVIATKVRTPSEIPPERFATLSAAEQAAACPPAVAKELDALEAKAEETVKAQAERDLKDADGVEPKAAAAAAAAESKVLKDTFGGDGVGLFGLTGELAKARAKSAADLAKAKVDAEKARVDARENVKAFREGGKGLLTAAKATYARWVYGVDARPAKVKFVSGDVTMTGPQRLAHLERVRRELKDAEDRQSAGLGTGTGTDNKRVAELRADALAAETDLAKDADAFVADLKKALNDDKAVEEAPAESRGQQLDRVTMWFLVVVGACLLAGLLTRVACVAAAGFLVTTYLLHPPVPWNPLPPGTEGNPIFINKNVIECLALLALACMPTGRWLGIDALLARVVLGPRRDDARPTGA